MNFSKRIAVASFPILAIMTTQSALAVGFGVEARSLAMGNTSVATSDIATAALTNPARLAAQKPEEDFSLLLPSIGIFLDDSDGLTDLVDQFQDNLPGCQTSGDIMGAECTAAINSLNSVAGRAISPQLAGSIALGVSGDTFSFAVIAKTDVLFAGGLDPTTIDVSSVAALQDLNNNQLALFGVQTSEIGVAVATTVTVAGLDIAVGVTPKVVQVESLVYRESIASSSTDADDLLDEDSVNDLGNFTTIDAGIVIGLTENIQLGVLAKNLLTDEFSDPNDPFSTVLLEFDTQLRAGIAYNGDILTLGVDLDLTENTIISSNFGDTKTQFLSAGIEFDAFEIAQLRVGMQQNIASGANDDVLLTAGVGLSFGIHVDVAAITDGDDVFGVFLQTWFRF